MAREVPGLETVVRGVRPERPKVSIIMPVLNQIEMTVQCVERIGRLTDATDYELIVINNGSTDGTRRYLDGLEDVVALHCPSNIGVGPAWNLGIETARGEYLCVINNDILVTPGWIDALLWPFEQDERVWCTGPLFTRGPVPRDFDLLAEFIAGSEPQLVAGGIVGFCFVLSRTAVDTLGLFDEQFETAWYEDTDYYCRLLASGHPPALVTNCLIHHYETRTARSELPKAGQEILARNERRFRKKWGRVVAPGTDHVYTVPRGSLVVRQPAPGIYPET